MNKQPPLDRSLLIPILIGGLSVVGILVVLLVGRALNSPPEVAATASSTPFRYVYLGTEPAVTTLIVEGSDIAPPTEEATATELQPLPATATRRPFSTLIILPSRTTGTTSGTGTPSRQPTSTRTSTPTAANTYDDTDSRLLYSGSWVSQAGVDNAYQDTLHISYTIGNSVSFTFTGTEVHFFYQAGQSLGAVTIFIDNDTLGITQSEVQGGEWVRTLEAGTHRVTIRHTSGGSVNIDRLVIPAPTPTPTKTPKP